MMHTQNCNTRWLEHTACPDIAWETWWWIFFKGNLLSRLTKPAELSHKWVLKIFKYQEPAFYDRLFDESEQGPFEVPPGHTNIDEIRKSVPGAPKL